MNVLPANKNSVAFFEKIWCDVDNRDRQMLLSETVMKFRNDVRKVDTMATNSIVINVCFRSLVRARLAGPHVFITEVKQHYEPFGLDNKLDIPKSIRFYQLLADVDLFSRDDQESLWPSLIAHYLMADSATQQIRDLRKEKDYPLIILLEGGVDSYDSLFDGLKKDEHWKEIARKFSQNMKFLAESLSAIVAYIGGPTVSDRPERHPDRLFKLIRAQLIKPQYVPAVHIWDVITPDVAHDVFTYLPPTSQCEAVYSEHANFIKKHVVPPMGRLLNYCLKGVEDSKFCKFLDE